VSERRSTGARLSGATSTESTEKTYPGERYGLPEFGPRSVATPMRRIGALLIDWLLCMVVAVALFHSQLWTLAVFGVETYLLTALTGFTVGKRVLGIQVARLDGRPVGLLWSLVRVILLLLVVPPLVFDHDLRGLHDQAAGTIVIRA
jgi:uncharacterized RDD family membrane protein YckC